MVTLFTSLFDDAPSKILDWIYPLYSTGDKVGSWAGLDRAQWWVGGLWTQ